MELLPHDTVSGRGPPSWEVLWEGGYACFSVTKETKEVSGRRPGAGIRDDDLLSRGASHLAGLSVFIQ